MPALVCHNCCIFHVFKHCCAKMYDPWCCHYKSILFVDVTSNTHVTSPFISNISGGRFYLLIATYYFVVFVVFPFSEPSLDPENSSELLMSFLVPVQYRFICFSTYWIIFSTRSTSDVLWSAHMAWLFLDSSSRWLAL